MSNFGLAVLVARRLSSDAYGAFALAFSVYAYAVTISRLLVSQPLMICYSGSSRTEFARAARQSTGAALGFALPIGLVTLIAGIVGGGALGAPLITTAVLLPGLFLQDAYRMVFFTMGRPAAAAANDAMWAVTQVAGVLIVNALGGGSAEAYLWAWGIAGCVAAVLGGVQAGLWPAPRETLRWLRRHTKLTRYSVTEVVFLNGANQLTLFLVAAIGGLSVVAALRGAQVLTAPTTVLTLGTMAFVVPEMARRPSLTGSRLIRAGLLISVPVATLMLLWGSFLLLLPGSLGRLLLGDTWAGTHGILLPTVVGMVAGVASLGASSGVYAKGGVKVLFPLMLLGAPVYLVAGLVGVLTAGAYGTAVGLAVAAAYGSVVSWVRFTRVARDSALGAPAGAGGGLSPQPRPGDT
ncbi:MAG: hypothetical protein ABJA34_12005 [Pseudonocardiales bacterium]